MTNELTKQKIEFYHEGALEAYEAVLHVIAKNASIDTLKEFLNLQISAIEQHNKVKVPSDKMVDHLKGLN